MVTTIQLNEDVKRELDKRKKKGETFEQVILGLIEISEECKRKQKELLIEECKEMAEENLKITKEFEAIEDLSQ